MAAAKARFVVTFFYQYLFVFCLNLLSGFSLNKVPNLLLLLYRKYADEMLLLYAADKDDDDFDILLVDALYKEPSPATFGFKINLDSLDEQMSIELFR